MSARLLVHETNPIPEKYHDKVTNEITESVDWTDGRLDKIVRLRLLSDYGYPYWDVSYCHGRLKTGEFVNVQLPFSHLPKTKMRRYIVSWAKREGVFAQGLGIFDAISTLI